MQILNTLNVGTPAPNANGNTSNAPAPAQEQPFAKMLAAHQSRAPAAPPAKAADKPTRPPAPSTDEADAAPDAAAAQAANEAAGETARSPRGAKAQAAGNAAHAHRRAVLGAAQEPAQATEGVAKKNDTKPADKDSPATQTDPAAVPLSAAPTLPSAPAPQWASAACVPGTTADTATAATGPRDAAATALAVNTDTAAPARTPLPRDTAPGQAAQDAAAGLAADATTPASQALQADAAVAMTARNTAADTDLGSTRPATTHGVPTFAAALAAITPDTPSTPSAVPTVTLSTPVSAPEFREAFGLQVSTLAREGLHRAQLQLNPADMGPVSVQIVLDGTQARVDFAVHSSVTRQAIESGLPELAAALRDAGFTLAGGGVSQQSHGQSQGQAHAPNAGRFADERGRSGNESDAVVERAPVSVRLPRGALDLYA